jgi:hypothetical protein
LGGSSTGVGRAEQPRGQPRFFEYLAIQRNLPRKSLMRPDNSISVEPLRSESFLLLLIAPDDESVDAQRDAVLRGIAEFLPALVKQTPV